MSRPFSVLRLAPAAAALLAVVACDDATAPDGGQRASLSFNARGDVVAAGVGGVRAQTAAGTVIVSGSDTLVIASVKMIIDEVELERGLASECEDDGDDTIEVTADCAELEAGPFLVNLPVSGASIAPVNVALPAGTYHELEMKLRQADSGDDRAFLAAHPEMQGITVLVTGTFRGQPFTWRGNVEAELELDFSPAMVVDGTSNFAVNIDIGGWFRNGSGAIIDPSASGPGTQGFETVALNIRNSFEVYEDDDRDGDDDHGDDSN